LILGGAGNDRITGGPGRDRILGQDGNDVISGRQGGDRLFGNDGNDLLRGGRGSDVLDGGNDDDTLRGNRGNDILLGGSGTDSLSGGNGKDILIGGTEADTLSGGRKADILIGGSTLLDDDIPALKAILREWTSGRRYARRTQNILGDSTSGRNNPHFFKPDEPDRTVSDDSQADRLNGNRGRDWFFADLDNADGDDDVVSRRSNELVELIKEL
jgi:Ca2+-binding RTX toxin-like protein